MKKLGLYIHIPFCVKKCHYCDFLSAPATSKVQKSYMEVLRKEIKEKVTEYRQWEVDTVFIGGGTPTSVPFEEIVQVMELLKEQYRLSEDCEVTIECNPGTATKEALKAYRSAGINRLSIGLQSADDGLLETLGRIHTYEQFLDTFSWAREVGFTNINVDLMSGLPNQTLEQYEDSLQKIVALGAEHISAYSLIVEEGTPFYKMYEKDALPLPDEDTERKMYHRTNELLKEAGFYRYEISNYCKPGYECRHNVRYWKRQDYVGFGLGAASCFEDVRYKNTEWLDEYVLENKYMEKNDVQALSKEECMEEFMFLGLRMSEGVSKKVFFDKFGVSFESVYQKVADRLVEQKLLETKGEHIFLTEYGMDVSNRVWVEFLL